MWIDAIDVKVRQHRRVVSVAVIIAVGVDADGQREVLGLDIGPSEAETFWTTFLRKFACRGLRGLKLVISYAHESLKAAVARVLNATGQRCRVGLLKKWLDRDSLLNMLRLGSGLPRELGSKERDQLELFASGSLRQLIPEDHILTRATVSTGVAATTSLVNAPLCMSVF